MIKLLKNLKLQQLILALVCLTLIVVQVWLELKMPDYMSKITVLVQTEGSQMKDILENGLYMTACAFGSLISAIVIGYIASNISATFSMNVRKKIFDKVENLSMNEIKSFSTSSLITRTTNDITQIQMLISMGLHILIKAPITAIWAITKILNKNWQWSAATALGVVILMVAIGIIMKIVIPRFKIIQKLIDKVNGTIRENLIGIRVVRAFNSEEYQENKFESINANLTNTQLFNQKAFALLSPIMYLVMYFLALSIYFIGAYLINNAEMTDKISLFGDMVVFSSYALQVLMSFLMMAIIFMMLPRAQVSADRINEVLDTKSSIKDGNINTNNTNKIGTVEFKNVSFKYPDSEDYLLKDITFKASKGETIAFIGSTGSGKSTLVNLIPRFYDVTDGEILVDGINVKEYNQSFLHKKIGYVPQKAVIFNDTIKENIAYGANEMTEISNNKIKESAEIAQAKDFIEKMENKYDTLIAPGGTNLSGGQKQRIAIIAKNPEIYIFDDSFSALDYKTDSILRKRLKEYTKDATTLIVAQRIGTIMNSDRIIVLDEGRIVGQGTHKELLENCSVYKQIALSQLSEEEL